MVSDDTLKNKRFEIVNEKKTHLNEDTAVTGLYLMENNVQNQFKIMNEFRLTSFF